MARLRESASISLSLLLSISLVVEPTWGTSPAGMGTVVSAKEAHVGTAAASVGTTVFAGDRLDTEQNGSLQLRSGAARLLLTGASGVTWAAEGAMPLATLTRGGVVFSTANARAFALKAGTAIFRPQNDQPTVGNVTMLGPKELVVRCSRGALTIAVEDDVRVISEGTAYRVVLDPEAAARAAARPTPASSGQSRNPPKKAGQSKFIWYAIAFTALVTAIALDEALESPDRP
jgi:hypothetical protein